MKEGLPGEPPDDGLVPAVLIEEPSEYLKIPKSTLYKPVREGSVPCRVSGVPLYNTSCYTFDPLPRSFS